MEVIGLMIFTLIGMGLITALSVALYASLPRSFMECSEVHGRFCGLRRDQLLSNGTPTSSISEGALSGQTA
jgi:hypothetical protein